MGWYEPYAAAGMFAYQNPGLAAAIGAGYTGYKTYRFYKKNKQSLKRGAILAGAALAVKRMSSQRGRSVQTRRRTRSQASMEISRPPSTRSRSVAVGRAANATGRWAVSRRLIVKRAPKRGRYAGGTGKFRRKKSYRAKKIKAKKMNSLYRDCFYKGAVIHQEFGAIATDSYCVSFGHTTPLAALRQAFWMAIIKKLMDRLMLQTLNPADPTNGIAAGDTIIVKWRNEAGPSGNPPVGPVLTDATLTCNAGESLLSMAERLRIIMNDVGVAGNDELMIDSIEFNPAGAGTDSTRVLINLQGAKVRFYYEGELKFQNRTSDGATNTEADDLVAQHVVGKVFYGNKNYAQLRSRSAGAVNSAGFCGNFNGTLLPSAIYGGNDFREPLPTLSILGSQGKGMRMQPAELRVSKITYKKETGFLQFVKEIGVRYDAGQASAQGNFKTYFGNYKYYMLEKEIETAATPLTPVTIGCEWQYKVGVVVDVSRNTFMQRVVYNSEIIP